MFPEHNTLALHLLQGFSHYCKISPGNDCEGETVSKGFCLQ